MPDTDFTLEDLKNIKKAIASGATEVWFGDRKVKYKSNKELLQAKELIEKELGLKKSSSKNVQPSFSKGL